MNPCGGEDGRQDNTGILAVMAIFIPLLFFVAGILVGMKFA